MNKGNKLFIVTLAIVFAIQNIDGAQKERIRIINACLDAFQDARTIIKHPFFTNQEQETFAYWRNHYVTDERNEKFLALVAFWRKELSRRQMIINDTFIDAQTILESPLFTRKEKNVIARWHVLSAAKASLKSRVPIA